MFWSLAVVVCVLTTLNPVSGCNEAICASQVSKCMLLKSCECNMEDKKNCTCCKDCHQCLANLYLECCSCVGLCPPAKDQENLLKTSSIEDLAYAIPDLFDSLTEGELGPWKVIRYPAHENLLYYKPEEDISTISTDKQGGSKFSQAIYKNCTVAFMVECMSLSKCKTSCKSMGASRFRWFHEHGCCECVGSTCLDYGRSTAECPLCPDNSDDDEENESPDSVKDIEEKDKS